MPTANLRYTAFPMLLNPGQTRVLHCEYDESLAGRTFAAVIDDIDLEVTVDGDVVDIIFDGSLTKDLSTRVRHEWFLYDTTNGDDPLQIEFGGPANLSNRGVDLPDASVVVTSRDVTVEVSVLGEPGPVGPPGPATVGYDPDLDEVFYDPFVDESQFAVIEIEDGQPVAVTQEV